MGFEILEDGETVRWRRFEIRLQSWQAPTQGPFLFLKGSTLQIRWQSSSQNWTQESKSRERVIIYTWRIDSCKFHLSFKALLSQKQAQAAPKVHGPARRVPQDQAQRRPYRAQNRSMRRDSEHSDLHVDYCRQMLLPWCQPGSDCLSTRRSEQVHSKDYQRSRHPSHWTGRMVQENSSPSSTSVFTIFLSLVCVERVHSFSLHGCFYENKTN